MAQLFSLGHFAPNKFMFNKSDRYFDEMAADPARRGEAIIAYSKQRNMFYICAMMISASAILEFCFGGRSSAGIFFAAAVSWSMCFKAGSDLRLLRAIDRLEKGSDEKPVA